MAMIHQTKVLKQILANLNIADDQGHLRVRTQKNKHGEYGRATAHVRYLTPEEIKAIRAESEYISIFNRMLDGYGFAIVEY